ncbi:MAG: hypothetical protein OSB29_08220 [Verrucomicrobiota bacterium]|nr:hypothetical protein [Verrucomicrobiota bacterium]
MKNIRPYLIGAAMAAAVLVVMGQAQAPKGPRWEYLYVEQRWVKFEPIDPNANGPQLLQAKLMNELGSEGWDMVQAGTGGYMFRRAMR